MKQKLLIKKIKSFVGIATVASMFFFTISSVGAQTTATSTNYWNNESGTYYENSNSPMGSTTGFTAHNDVSHMWHNVSWQNDWHGNWENASGTILHRKIMVPMTGSQEVPPVGTSMTGTTTLWIYASTTPANASTSQATTTTHRLDYRIDLKNADNVIAAHIHCGVQGVNGPVIVNLFNTIATSTGVDVSNGLLASNSIANNEIIPVGTTTPGCNPQITTVEDLIQAAKNNRIYVNVHTIQHPNGEVRGQIARFVATSTGTTTPPTGTTTPPTTGTTTPPATGTPNIQAIINALNAMQATLATLQSQIQSLLNQLGTGSGGGSGGSGNLFTNAAARVASPTVVIGTTNDFAGDHFQPYEQVTMSFEGQVIKTMNSDKEGNWSTGSIFMPLIPGQKTYTFRGLSSGAVVPVNVQVTQIP